MSLGIVYFILAILVIIMIHEAGHFVAAKRLGFKATKFFLGFGPTLFSFHKGETEYGIKALPLGGFVKIVGMNPYEEVAPEDEHRSYPNKPKWQRAIVILGGPVTHWILAFVVLTATMMTIGLPTSDASNEVAEISTEIEGTRTPAATAGLREGDVIVGIGTLKTDSWNEIRSYIREHGDERASFVVERDGKRVTLDVTLGRAIVAPSGEVLDLAPPGGELRVATAGEEVVGFFGVQPEPKYETLSLPSAISQSGTEIWRITTGSVAQLGSVFTPIFDGTLLDAIRGEGERPQGVGLVGASRIAGETVEAGRFLQFIDLMIVLTIFLGIMNLLPLPPLDGGHLAIIGYEAITNKRVDIRKIIPVAAAVISFFLILFVAFLYLDIVDPIRLPL